MRRIRVIALLGASILATPVAAQDMPGTAQAREEDGLAVSNDIVVTARRREETLQDVPQTVNVVTSDQIDKLNVRTLNDIQSLVPGLTLSGGGSFSTTATVRGVAFNVEASGNNPTIEFYLNDAPISSNFLFQSLFDVGQFELLRGPQGTLRGRASPSGSITVTTKRPDLTQAGVIMNATATDTHAYKIDGALNVPIIENVLGLRIAGVADWNQNDRVRTIRAIDDPTHSLDPFRSTQAIRASARFEPADFASFNFMAQILDQKNGNYQQVQSASLVTGQPLTGQLIRPYDRLAITDLGSRAGQYQQMYVWNAEFRFAGQKLNYTGTHNKQDLVSISDNDSADYFAPPRFAVRERTFADPVGNRQVCSGNQDGLRLSLTNGEYYQCTNSLASRNSHELRLSSDAPIAGIFDYVVGALYDKNTNQNYLTQETPLLAAPTFLLAVNLTPIISLSGSTEKSFFGNLTAKLGGFELSGGLRHINYKNYSSISVSGATLNDVTNDDKATVYTGSLKYKFNDSLMAYALVGSSWRPGVRVVGNFSARQSARERSFLNLDPETSTSYEAGIKASFMDGRGRINLSVFQQDFDNYVFRGPGVYYVNYRALTATVTVPEVASFNYVAAVPVRVRGIEGEASFKITPNWGITANASYADGKIRGGTIACNDLNGDGIPDANSVQPTLAQLQAAVGAGQNVAQCSGFRSRANLTPKFNANLQTEAGFKIGPVDAFARGLATYTGSNDGDPNNSFDDVGDYTVVNLYAGLRDPEGAWEISLFAKNVFNKRVVFAGGGNFGVGTAPETTTLTTLTFGPTGQPTGSVSSSFSAPYYPVSILPPRELGISMRFAFGSR
ncbi:TonB-dependent receptor [Novosphingobium sp. PS1R-30]|uniref:TonB-dependent receptor n=1 Tax=Novosphingobium anseongense TaxID=3133436 RepID=A0ABU8S0Q6_9SPHN